MDENGIASKISAIVINEYKKLKVSSKPITRSNGVKEWTVLAGIVAYNLSTEEYHPISITTGVKATPDSELSRSCGKMIHDGHAEILALRSFNTVLLHEIRNIQQGSCSKFISKSDEEGIYSWNKELKIALYISKLPCGDASMDTIKDSTDPDAKFPIMDDDPYQFIDPTNTTILRGRLNFKRRKVVRTKPGRFDSNITLSKSCSDKLFSKQIMSVLNSLTWSLFDHPIYIRYIIVPNLSAETQEILNKQFANRIKNLGIPISTFRFITCNEQFPDDNVDSLMEPSSLNGIKLIFGPNQNIEQSILNGVKNGFYSKGKKPLRKNCESSISRYAQWQVFKMIEGISTTASPYLSFKASQTSRNDLKERLRSKMSPDGWISTSKDNCL